MGERIHYTVNRQADAEARAAIPQPIPTPARATITGPLGGAGDTNDPAYWPLLIAYTAAWIVQWDALYSELMKPCHYPDENGSYDFHG